MDKPNIKTTRLLLVVSVLVNLLLIGFLGFKYLKSINNPIPNYAMTNQTNDDELKFYLQRDKVFAKLPNDSNEVIMLGNSLTHNFEWHEMFPTVNIKNRGINGDITLGLLQRLPEVTESNPAKIFIEIGINDIQQGVAQEEILKNYKAIIEQIQENSPQTKIYIQSILPTSVRLFNSKTSAMESIVALNSKLKDHCKTQNLTYINLFTTFENDGKLNSKYDCGDKLHLSAAGYLMWCQLIEKYVYE